ncbi:MAG: hypothetical protein K2F64_01230 [Muribaculaceae bacterium]|nr:hypothetical protein [Muribaculaceae bacterium]
MAKIKQAAGNELHWCIESWNQGKDANNHLRNIIRDENLRSMFANVSVSNSIIVWNHPDPDWQMLSAADEATAKAVRDLFGNQEAKLKAKAPSYAERLMRVPNEDYIFFKITPEGNIKLLLTGWGYTNSKKAEGSSYRKKVQLDPVCDIKVGFSVNGEPVP